MIKYFAMTVVAIALVVGLSACASNVSAFHEDIPFCEGGDFGWYLISGNDDIGYAVFLTKQPVKFKEDPEDQKKYIPTSEPEIICTVRSDAVIYVFGKTKKVSLK